MNTYDSCISYTFFKTTGHFYQYQWLCFMEYKGHADSAIGILMLAVDVYR